MIHVRVEESVKRDATEALAAMGLTMSEAVRVFLKRIAAEQALPFALAVPNAETRSAMTEARAIGAARFTTAEQLFDNLEQASSS